MLDLILGASVDRERIATLQTRVELVVRQIFESIKIISPDSTVWIDDPSWPSHQYGDTYGFQNKIVSIFRWQDTDG